MIHKELKPGRIAGPFQHPLFQNFTVSPLGMVPKKDSGKFRMIHDLSSPPNLSVNDYISPEDA